MQEVTSIYRLFAKWAGFGHMPRPLMDDDCPTRITSICITSALQKGKLAQWNTSLANSSRIRGMRIPAAVSTKNV